MSDESKRITDAELQEIHKTIEDAEANDDALDFDPETVCALLSEVRRLRGLIVAVEAHEHSEMQNPGALELWTALVAEARAIRDEQRGELDKAR